MAAPKMGFEGVLYYGAAGSTASTQLLNVKDITITRDLKKGNTTVRGTGSTAPIETESTTGRTVQIEWNMINDTADTSLAALRSAAASGAPVAIRGKDYSSGMGPDMDVIVTCKDGMPLDGEMTFDFSATPTLAGGRMPVSYT